MSRLKRRFPRLDPLEHAGKDYLIGRFYESLSNHRLAIAWTQRALQVYRARKDPRGIHLCLRLLFSSFTHLGQYQKARACASETLAEGGVGDSERLKVLINLGGLELRVFNYQDAFGNFEKALGLLERSSDERSKAIVLYNMGTLCVYLNRFAEAEHKFSRAHALFKKERLQIPCAYVLQAFGNLYIILGQYLRAEERVGQAKKAYLSAGDRVGALLCDVELLRLDNRLNRSERVLDRLPDLIATLKAKKRSLEVGLLYRQGVKAAMALSEWPLVEEYLKRASHIFKREKNQQLFAWCTMIQGVVYSRAGLQKRAIGKLVEARCFFSRNRLDDRELECWIYLAQIHETKLEPKHGLRVRHLLKRSLTPSIRVQGLFTLSNYWYQKGQVKKSIRALFEAINTLEESRASIASDRLRARFFEDKTQIYESLINRLFQWKNPRAQKLIFKAMELSRSRQMSELLSRRESLPPVLNQNDPLILELQRLKLYRQQLNRKAETLSEVEESSQSELKSLAASIENLKTTIGEIKDQMSNEGRLGFYYPVEFKVEDIEKRILPHHLLVMYFLGALHLYRIEMDGKRIRTYRMPLPESFVSDLSTLSNYLTRRIPGKAGRVVALAEKLSRLLMPVRTKNIHHFTFVLHKGLQRFPLALLCKNGRYLIEKATISQCPNLAVFYFSNPRPKPQFRKPVFFYSDHDGDPRAEERQVLSQKFPEATVYADLSSDSLAQKLRTSEFLHFAGHCRFDRVKPENSYLQLAQTRISFSEYAKMRFEQRPFINLAACQSGDMALDLGNEPRGFVVSSFAAGASVMLAGLWDVDDAATGAWMSVFYQHMDQGIPEAYRQACLSLSKQYPDPYYWSGFCLLGRCT